MSGALRVCIAAVYYVLMLGNMEKARRKDLKFLILQATLQYFDAYFTIVKMTDWNTLEEFYEKHDCMSTMRHVPSSFFLLNHFNTL